MKDHLRKLKHLTLSRGISGITSSSRVLPDFLIIGAKRCGTTTLYENLSEHPCIEKSAHDNIGFFNDNFLLGINWYKSHFPTMQKKKEIKKKYGKFVTYDVTTSYMRRNDTAIKIKETIPDVKIIAILRNPVDRAYSEYNTNSKNESSNETFENLVLQEINTYHKIKDQDTEILIKKLKLIGKGLYEIQLKKWFEIFSRDSILILSTEEFAIEPNSLYSKIFRFLELPEYKIKNTQKFNKNTYSIMSDKTRQILLDFYSSENKKLFNLIGQEFDWKK